MTRNEVIRWKKSVTKARDGKTFFAVGHVQGESVGGVVVAGQFVHLVALDVDLLAGPGQGIVCRDIVELYAAILLCFCGKDEGVDRVPGLGGEFEQRAVVLSVCGFGWFDHLCGCCWACAFERHA